MIKISPYIIKYPVAGIAFVSAMFYPIKSSAQLIITETKTKVRNNTNTLQSTDTFVKTGSVTPAGTSDPKILSKAPSPKIKIQGEDKNAKIVVDLSKNILYHYDNEGNPLTAYLIASGKRQTPTDQGIRVVSHIEYHDYKTAPSYTKRYQNPDDYGPMIIILRVLDPKTGETSKTGEFIHGNNNPASLGKYASKGCMRMDNDVIQYLAPQMKRGDIVIITKTGNK